MTARETITAISPPMNQIGSAFYFHPDTLAKGKELGLDGFRFYFLGRGGVLGDVAPAVVGSAFAYFHPAVVDKIWTSAKEKLAPAEAAAAYGVCCAEVGRRALAAVDRLDAFCAAAEKVIAATDPAGLTLFAGWAAEPLVDDTPGRAMQLAAVLRELRGSAHIIAVLASGLTAAEAHAVKRPDETATFGWDPAPEVDASHIERHAAADELTTTLLERSFAGLSADEHEALIGGTMGMATALGLS